MAYDLLMLLQTSHFAQCVPTRWRNSFFIYLVKKMIFRKDLELPLFFVLFLRENKIRKKTLGMTPYLEKTVCEKPNLSLGVRLLIGKVR